MATPSEIRKRQEAYLREAEEQQRRNGVPPFKNGADMLQAWRDLFDSDEEMEEFGLYIRQMREEERARYRDRPAVAHIVLDTDVVSLYRTGRLPADFARHVAANDLSITFATAGELWKWALARRWGGPRRGGLELFLDQALILPASLKVAKVWGELAASTQRRGRPRPLNDTWIAACCIEGGLPLLTLNRRDFTDFVEHDGLMLLG